jgi:hypothetical protein
LSAWLTQADLAGTPETDIVSGFCDRCVTAGIPLGRAHVFIDTLHPVHEGRLFRWGYGPEESPVHEYDRTSLQGLDASAPVSLDLRATDSWRRSPFYNMLQTGDSLLRRTLMETYLGRDAGQRMLSGRIVRGVAERIDAVVWFSDLRGFTRIIDRARTGNPIAERLLRCDRFSDPRTWGEDGKGAVADQLEFITAIEFSAGGEVWKQYFTGSPDRSERGICRVAALTLFSVVFRARGDPPRAPPVAGCSRPRRQRAGGTGGGPALKQQRSCLTPWPWRSVKRLSFSKTASYTSSY